MKTQVTRNRTLAACVALAAAVTVLAGCSHDSTPAQQNAANQTVVQAAKQQANSMDAWRQAHPGQEHP